MIKEQFSSLQELHRLNGLSLLKFLQREHVSYSTYNYWKCKSARVPAYGTSAPQSVCIKAPAYLPPLLFPECPCCFLVTSVLIWGPVWKRPLPV